jgi:hypothetical protein
VTGTTGGVAGGEAGAGRYLDRRAQDLCVGGGQPVRVAVDRVGQQGAGDGAKRVGGLGVTIDEQEAADRGQPQPPLRVGHPHVALHPQQPLVELHRRREPARLDEHPDERARFSAVRRVRVAPPQQAGHAPTVPMTGPPSQAGLVLSPRS